MSVSAKRNFDSFAWSCRDKIKIGSKEYPYMPKAFMRNTKFKDDSEIKYNIENEKAFLVFWELINSSNGNAIMYVYEEYTGKDFVDILDMFNYFKINVEKFIDHILENVLEYSKPLTNEVKDKMLESVKRINNKESADKWSKRITEHV